MSDYKIIANQIRTPDGTVLRSFHRHHFNMHTDANGYEYGVDGGMDYLKRTHTEGAPPAEDCSIYSDEPFDIVREYLAWGSYGKDGKDDLHYITLEDMTTEHINACLINCPHMATHYHEFMLQELAFRREHPEFDVRDENETK